ncbi:hypothetical protein BRADI_5g08265v3 [Brachypodium distachyon]|uniref:Uncharacterized protein n=1 Tax=Brachypodium distachyon TaxID=15368 RepID=I1IX52_BRADI|nr:hypothetical protein BRADI_5g08265v3 [Brachypodium distachyon]
MCATFRVRLPVKISTSSFCCSSHISAAHTLCNLFIPGLQSASQFSQISGETYISTLLSLGT